MSHINTTAKRILAIDATRGLAMVLMAVDHASYAFNAGRYVTDSAAWHTVGSTIPETQFLIRWMTHLCAPTFVFLAGLVLAFSIERKRTEGITDRRIDIDLLVRGAILLILDPLWMSIGFGGRMIFQILYAIGASFICIAVLRRLGTGVLIIIGSALLAGSEVLAGAALWFGGGQAAGPIGTFLVTGGRVGHLGYVIYPLLPWLSIMVLGLGCGRLFAHRHIEGSIKWLCLAGVGLFTLFAIVRGINGYGNMLLYREDQSLVQWLHVSKYPPSLSFALMTLGLMALLLALFTRFYKKGASLPADPLLLLGRVPLFFYLLHVHLLSGAAKLLGIWKNGGLAETFIATGGVLLFLYPLCWWYARTKAKRPEGLLRYI